MRRLRHGRRRRRPSGRSSGGPRSTRSRRRGRRRGPGSSSPFSTPTAPTVPTAPSRATAATRGATFGRLLPRAAIAPFWWQTGAKGTSAGMSLDTAGNMAPMADEDVLVLARRSAPVLCRVRRAQRDEVATGTVADRNRQRCVTGVAPRATRSRRTGLRRSGEPARSRRPAGSAPSWRAAQPVWSHRSASRPPSQWTISTGTLAWRTISLETDGRRNRSSQPRSSVPTTMTSTPRSSAARRMAWPDRPPRRRPSRPGARTGRRRRGPGRRRCPRRHELADRPDGVRRPVRPHRAVGRRVRGAPAGAVPRDGGEVGDVGDVDGEVLRLVTEEAVGRLGGSDRALRVVDSYEDSSHGVECSSPAPSRTTRRRRRSSSHATQRSSWSGSGCSGHDRQ